MSLFSQWNGVVRNRKMKVEENMASRGFICLLSHRNSGERVFGLLGYGETWKLGQTGGN